MPQARDWGPVTELVYETSPANAEVTLSEPTASELNANETGSTHAGVYEPWRPRSLRIPGACGHPTPLVQSAAMAAVPHPVPAYRPLLPVRVVTGGLLSDAQLESVILAGQAHSHHLKATYRIGEGWETTARVNGKGDVGNGDVGNDDDDNNVETINADPKTDTAVTADGEALSAPVRFPPRLDAGRRHLKATYRIGEGWETTARVNGKGDVGNGDVGNDDDDNNVAPVAERQSTPIPKPIPLSAHDLFEAGALALAGG